MASLIFSQDNLSAAVLVNGGATEFAKIVVTNTSGASTFIQVFNKKAIADVTLGTTVPDMSIFVANNATLEVTPNLLLITGLVIAATTTYKGATGAANGVIATVGWMG